MQFQTICHNPAHTGSHKLYYYPATGDEGSRSLFHCYTQCGDSFDIYTLIMRAKHCSFFEALCFIEDTLHLSLDRRVGFLASPAEKLLDDWDVLNKYAPSAQNGRSAPSPYKCLPNTLVDFYTRYHPLEWLKEGISPEAMDRYNIRFNTVDNEIIIPHYDINGNLIGIRSRSLDPVKVASGNKYMPTQLEGKDFRHALRYNLYGLDKCKAAIQRTGKIMIAESEKACLLGYSYYGEDNFIVSVCGSNITNYQRDMILGLKVREVFIAFDKEYHEAFTPESDRYADKLLRLAGMFSPYATTYCLYDTEGLLMYKDAPVDRGREVLEKLMSRKFEIETRVEAT